MVGLVFGGGRPAFLRIEPNFARPVLNFLVFSLRVVCAYVGVGDNYMYIQYLCNTTIILLIVTLGKTKLISV